MKDSVLLTFLYKTIPGRALLRFLVQPRVSRAAGRFLSSGASAWLAPYYIRRHKIDMNGVEIPPGGFASFNAFFTRKRTTEASELLPGHLISPCDGFLTPIQIRDDTVFGIKYTEFTLEDLLRDRELAGRFRDGLALVFRLTPANYHRYCYAADGVVCRRRRIPGKLHCVRPVALGTFPVFAQNSREYQVIRTEAFGTIVQMEVGALLVGKICNREISPQTNRVRACEEKGCFEFGGSTILLLLPKDAVRLSKTLSGRQKKDGEIPVRLGERVADAAGLKAG